MNPHPLSPSFCPSFLSPNLSGSDTGGSHGPQLAHVQPIPSHNSFLCPSRSLLLCVVSPSPILLGSDTGVLHEVQLEEKPKKEAGPRQVLDFKDRRRAICSVLQVGTERGGGGGWSFLVLGSGS